MRKKRYHADILFCHDCQADLHKVTCFLVADGKFYCNTDCHQNDQLKGDYVTSPNSKWKKRNRDNRHTLKKKHPFLLSLPRKRK